MTNAAGIPHTLFTLEHRSMSEHAGLPRQMYCILQVVLSGPQSSDWTSKLKIGCEVKVEGNLGWQQGRNKPGRHLLHAETIKLIS